LETKGLSVEPVLNHTCMLGEGPVWDSSRNTICWVDIVSGRIHEYSETTKQHRAIDVHEMIGSFALCTDGNYLAALKNGLARVDRSDGGVHLLHHPEIHLPGNRFNEGKCDPEGRFWVGSMALSEEHGAGSLYMVNKDLSYSRKIEGVTISNGLAWSLDGRTMYYIDSPTREVVAYDYIRSSGELFNRRVIIRVPDDAGFPDGMTIDTEGMLWIAHWDGWQVARWNPYSGQMTGRIRLPVARVTSCTFGGEGLKDLYITSASTGLSPDEAKRQPLAGALFVARDCGCSGLEPIIFEYSGGKYGKAEIWGAKS
jgi:sugar lactone lactonase YvrE